MISFITALALAVLPMPLVKPSQTRLCASVPNLCLTVLDEQRAPEGEKGSDYILSAFTLRNDHDVAVRMKHFAWEVEGTSAAQRYADCGLYDVWGSKLLDKLVWSDNGVSSYLLARKTDLLMPSHHELAFAVICKVIPNTDVTLKIFSFREVVVMAPPNDTVGLAVRVQ